MAIYLGISGQVVCGLDVLTLRVKCFYVIQKFRETASVLLLTGNLKVACRQFYSICCFILWYLVFVRYLSYKPPVGACDASAIQVHEMLEHSLVAFPTIKIQAIRLQFQEF